MDGFKWINHHLIALSGRWPVLWCLVIAVSGCASAELTRLAVNETSETYYRYVCLDVELSDAADAEYLTSRLIKKLDAYDLQISAGKQMLAAWIPDEPGSALLKVEELGRRLEAGEHRQTYGRISLTRMRGRKKHEKPVITLRVILVDTRSGQTVYQADYNTEGPWYSDSSKVAGALAEMLIDQLALGKYFAEKNTL